MEIVKVIENINRGGFGIIDKVELNDGSIVARKTFSPKDKDTIDGDQLNSLRRRFSREVKTQEKFPSEYFIPILYSFLEGDEPYFLMPIADRVYIDEIKNSRINSTPPQGLADILNCLEYLHNMNYVHRDLKPGNILFHEGKWKLADMGLITSDTELTTTYVTSDGFVAGSELYMAPEQHINFHNVTHHADIYSFGAILHDVFCNVKRAPCSTLSGPGEIGLIIKKCTEEKIFRRFNDVTTLRSVLLSFLAKKTHLSKTDDDEVEKWQEALKISEEWDQNKLDSFVMYITQKEISKEVLFYEITSSIIENFHKIDIYLWKQFILEYFDWVFTKSFSFDYCDAIIGYIFQAYELTNDLEIKSSGALVGAELGSSHNRWYVMRYVIRMCSVDISENLAERLSIEIHVSGHQAKGNLKTCLNQLKTNIDRYHPLIQKALN